MINMLDIKIWEREFSLPVEYEIYEGESISDSQVAALKRFKSHKSWIRKAKASVEAFCLKQVLEDNENNKKDNIFSYVKPEAILVKRDQDNPRVALMCKYRYDIEHGMAVVFSHDGQVTVGIQDIIL